MASSQLPTPAPNGSRRASVVALIGAVLALAAAGLSWASLRPDDPKTWKSAYAGLVCGEWLGVAAAVLAVIAGVVGCATGQARRVLPLALLAAVLGVMPMAGVAIARNHARRESSKNNLKLVRFAIHEYEQRNGGLPPRAICDKQGRPLLSWHVAVLPQDIYKDLYDSFHLNEPWDSPHNIALLHRMPQFYQSPGRSPDEKTCFQAISHDDAVLIGCAGIAVPIADGRDPVLLVESTSDAAVDWTKPDDVDGSNPLRCLSDDSLLMTVGGKFNLRADFKTPAELLDTFSRNGKWNAR